MASHTVALAARRQSGDAIRAADRLVVALDLEDVERAHDLVERLGDTVSCYKVGYYLQLVSGYDRLVDDLVARGKNVFLDTKVCDIEQTMRAAVRGAVRRGARFLTIHGNGDVTDSALQAAADEKAGSNLNVLLVTVLTSLDDLDLHRHGYKNASTLEVSKDRARRALDFGLSGVICSGMEASMIREMAASTSDFIIATPGIRPSGSARNDQKRVCTPAEAIENGSDFLIVGRPIVQARDPSDAADRIIEEMSGAFGRR